MSCRGVAWRGVAWRGVARRGVAWDGTYPPPPCIQGGGGLCIPSFASLERSKLFLVCSKPSLVRSRFPLVGFAKLTELLPGGASAGLERSKPFLVRSKLSLVRSKLL